MRTLPSLALFAAAAVFAAAAGPDGRAAPVPKHLMPLPSIEGRWEVQAYRKGKEPKPVQPGEKVIEITAGSMVWVLNAGQVGEGRITGALSHDPTARHLLVTGRSISPREGFPDVIKNIGFGYTLDGHTLTIAYRCSNSGDFVPADPRNPGDDAHVYGLTRAQK